MTYQGRFTPRAQAAMTPMPGEIWHFVSHLAPYEKYHLCVSHAPSFLLFNKPKLNREPRFSDFVIDERHVPRLPRNPKRVSMLCCSVVVPEPKGLVLREGDKRGSLPMKQILKVLDFIEGHELIAVEETRDWLPDLRRLAELFPNS